MTVYHLLKSFGWWCCITAAQNCITLFILCHIFNLFTFFTGYCSNSSSSCVILMEIAVSAADLNSKWEKEPSLSQTWFLGLEAGLSTVKLLASVCASDISLIHTEPTFRACFSPQLLTNSVSLMEFMIPIQLLALNFFTGLLGFCPLQHHVYLPCIWSVYPLSQGIQTLNTLQSETPAYRCTRSAKDAVDCLRGRKTSLYSRFLVF